MAGVRRRLFRRTLLLAAFASGIAIMPAAAVGGQAAASGFPLGSTPFFLAPSQTPPQSAPPQSAPVAFQLPQGIHLAPAIMTAGPGCSQQSVGGMAEEVCSYSETGGVQSLTLPSPVTWVHLVLVGAGGGTGGNGGKISGDLNVGTPGEILSIYVGGGGGGDSGGGSNPNGGPGGYNGGGNGANGHNGGGGGGGGTSVLVGGTNEMEAGGGGGSGGYGAGQGPSAGGNGGDGASGGNGQSGTGGGCIGYGGLAGAVGGGGGSGSNAGICSVDEGGGGGNAVGTTGGGGGGGSGAAGSGGGGGGGGGGWTGGGGGGGGSTDSTAGGGGGGSDGANSSTTYSVSDSPATGAGAGSNGSAQVSWPLLTPTVSLTSSASTSPLGLPGGVPLTAFVRAAADPGYVATGTVTFTDSSTGQTLCAAVPLNGTGIATCAATTGSIGTNTFSASYSGDDVVAQGSGTLGVQGTQDATTTNAPTVSGSGTRLTLTTSVSTPYYAVESLGQESGTTNGTIVFSVAKEIGTSGTYGAFTTACTQTIPSTLAKGTNATGEACNYTAGIPGNSYEFEASYAGNTDNAPSTSPPPDPTQNIARVTPVVSLAPLSGAPSLAGLTYGNPVTFLATVAGLPPTDTTGVGDVEYEYADGIPALCSGASQPNPAAVNTSTGQTSTSCTIVPPVGNPGVQAVFLGDAQANRAVSPTTLVPVSPARSAIQSITVTPENSIAAYGVPLTVTAIISDSSSTGVPPLGVTSFSQDGAVISGCSFLTPVEYGSSGAGTSTVICHPIVPPTDLMSHSFAVNYCPSATPVLAGCENWLGSNANTTYQAGPDPTSVTLTPGGTETHPLSETGGADCHRHGDHY